MSNESPNKDLKIVDLIKEGKDYSLIRYAKDSDIYRPIKESVSKILGVVKDYKTGKDASFDTTGSIMYLNIQDICTLCISSNEQRYIRMVIKGAIPFELHDPLETFTCEQISEMIFQALVKYIEEELVDREYVVTIQKVLERTIEIEASSESRAREIISAKYNNNEIVLDDFYCSGLNIMVKRKD